MFLTHYNSILECTCGNTCPEAQLRSCDTTNIPGLWQLKTRPNWRAVEFWDILMNSHKIKKYDAWSFWMYSHQYLRNMSGIPVRTMSKCPLALAIKRAVEPPWLLALTWGENGPSQEISLESKGNPRNAKASQEMRPYEALLRDHGDPNAPLIRPCFLILRFPWWYNRLRSHVADTNDGWRKCNGAVFFFESLHHPFFFNPAPALLWLLWRLNLYSQVKVQKNINSKCLREWISKNMLCGLYASCKGCLHGLSITIPSIENKLRDLPIWRSIRSWSKNQEKSNQKEIKEIQRSWQS